MYYAMMSNESGAFGGAFPHSLMLFLVKIPCSIALHLLLYPNIERGLALMKFSNNNPELFVEHGALISYIIGFILMLTGSIAEIVNM